MREKILKFGKDNGKYRGLHTFRCFSYEPLILLEKPPTAYGLDIILLYPRVKNKIFHCPTHKTSKQQLEISRCRKRERTRLLASVLLKDL
jgi:hypothetical protein